MTVTATVAGRRYFLDLQHDVATVTVGKYSTEGTYCGVMIHDTEGIPQAALEALEAAVEIAQRKLDDVARLR